MSSRPRAAVLAVITALSLVACTEADNGNNTLAYNKTEQPSAPSTPPGAPQSTAPAKQGGKIALEAKDNVFAPETITAPAGTIQITMENTGKAPHTFTNKDLGVDVNANAGQTVEVKIEGAKPGSYKIICIYHETIGMVGTLTVT